MVPCHTWATLYPNQPLHCIVSPVLQVPPELTALLPQLAALLARGRDNTAALPILESHMLLGAAQRWVGQHARSFLVCMHGILCGHTPSHTI